MSVNFFFFLIIKEVLVDYLLPATEAASCSSQQWEKEKGRRVKGGQGAGWAAGGGKTPSLRREQVHLKTDGVS